MPLSFYREGVVDFESFRYMHAYSNFYYFLEGLYGKGEWRTKKVTESFQSSTQVRLAVEQTIDLIKKQSDGKHTRGLTDKLTSYRLDLDTDGVIKLLVRIRGDLHHFHLEKTQDKYHPLNVRQLETPAYVIMSVCTYVFTQLGTGIDRS